MTQQPIDYSPYESLYASLLGNQLGGAQGFGNQLQGAMGAFGGVAGLNSLNNANLNNANLGYASQYQAPIDQAKIQTQGAIDLAKTNQAGKLAQIQALSPLLSSMFGGGGGSGGGGGGLTGFQALGADGKPYASASLPHSGTPAGGGSTGGQLGAPQPGNSSTAQPTNVAGFLNRGETGFGQYVAPADAAAAMARFKQTGHYSPMPYATQGAGIAGGAAVPRAY